MGRVRRLAGALALLACLVGSATAQRRRLLETTSPADGGGGGGGGGGASSLAEYGTREEGERGTSDYRVFLTQSKDGAVISPWHDVPLYAGDGLVRMLVEIPAGTAAKMETFTRETYNPIGQDTTKDGQLRSYYTNISWSYGALPQTWEDPNHVEEDTGARGDNDPLDALEIGSQDEVKGGIYAVKPICALALLDAGEMDWKVITIRSDDPLAPGLDDVEDLERELPGELDAIREWFRTYKVPQGGKENEFGYDGRCLDGQELRDLIDEMHGLYSRLRSGRTANKGGLALA